MSVEDHVAQLIETLDDELEQLTTLRFRLVALAALVAAGHALWLPMSVRDLEVAIERLRLADLRRAAATSGITEAFWLSPEARLPEIAAKLDDGWAEILQDRRRELLEQVANVQNVAELAISAMGRRSALISEALRCVSSDGGSTYGRQSPRRARIVQGAM